MKKWPVALGSGRHDLSRNEAGILVGTIMTQQILFGISSSFVKTHQFGAICTTPGNLCLYGTAWWGWEDSNFQPNDYQPRALSTEQRARFRGPRGGLGGLELSTKRLSVASFEQPPSIAGPRMAWASLASPACRRNGPDSASLRSNRTHTRTESLGSGLCARKRNFCGRDEAAETVSLKFNWPFAENSFGHFAMHEIPTSEPLVNA